MIDSRYFSLLQFPMLALFTLSREGSLEGSRPHRILSRLCRCGSSDSRFSSVRRPRAESDSHFFPSFGNLQTLWHSNPQIFLRSIPFRIKSFAHLYHLTPVESYSCKKQGRGRGIQSPCPTESLSLLSTANRHPARRMSRNSIPFMSLPRNFRIPRRWTPHQRSASVSSIQQASSCAVAALTIRGSRDAAHCLPVPFNFSTFDFELFKYNPRAPSRSSIHHGGSMNRGIDER
jgi:hypothetical protein